MTQSNIQNQSIPIVAIVGRANVGKSSLFNKIAGKRISIVKDEIGVTRDRIYTHAEWCGVHFELIDTGGIDIKNKDNIWQTMLSQAKLAVELASVIILVVDGKAGLQQSDLDVANFLKKSGKPTVLAVNKIDNIKYLDLIYDFYSLGLGQPYGISCEQMLGLGDLLDVVLEKSKKNEFQQTESIKIAIVGKPNAGKSSIVNKLLGYDRVIVNEVAGTTRDAIDTEFQKDGKNYTIIDTAGLRRKRNIEEDTIESYGVIRTISAIKRANIVLIVVDASEDFCEQTVKICGLAHEEKKPTIVIINKWDLVQKDSYTMQKFENDLKSKLAFMSYFVPLFISAKTGQRIHDIINLVDKIISNSNKRISTSVLNDIIGSSVAANQPFSSNGRRIKIFYATQPEASPPKFIVFCNDSTLIHDNYKRYLENCIRKAVDFSGVPLTVYFNNSKKDNS
ncbi:MAG: ribosome biogenesis GTPase Der [Firmicutes bacterium]|nr:ribosome biogenesis GTPase Der [Bacillota bacterium]MCL1953639.1 ribosome biogenesis GTPase Der [Bacillota bacterium]